MKFIGCSTINISNSTVTNISGTSNLIMIMNCFLNYENSIFSNIWTYSPTVFYAIFSKIIFDNMTVSNFYPLFVYTSFCFIWVKNSIFKNYFDNDGIFQVGALKLEQNNSYRIESNTFVSLKNIVEGPVKNNIYNLN